MQEKSRKRQGRPEAQPLSPDLLESVKSYPYSEALFEADNPEDYKESGLREVVNVISEKIRRYIVRNPRDYDFADLVKYKLGDAFQEYRNGNLRIDLLDTKTLKRCLVEGRASEATANILTAFKIVCEKDGQRNREMERVSGLFYALTTHSTQPGTFQVSLIKISEDGSFVKHIDSNHELETKNLSAEMVSSANLLLTLREGKKVLFFYLYVGAANHPPFIQGVIMYSNLYGNTVSNLAVFARVRTMEEAEEKAFIDNFIPQRGIKEIPDLTSDLARSFKEVANVPGLTVIKNIQYFLLHQARPLLSKVYNNVVPFDFSQSVGVEPGPYGQTARDYAKAKTYTGEYYIYYNERFKSARANEENLSDQKKKYFSAVGVGLFAIEMDKKSGVLKCSMRTLQNEKGKEIKHDGFVINTRLGVGPYLLMSLYTGHGDDRCAILLLKIVDHSKMTGGHVVAYDPWGEMGAGAVVLVRREVIDNDKKLESRSAPEVVFPSSSAMRSELEQKIANYLSMRRRGLVIPPDYEDIGMVGSDNKYEGLYKMYSVRRDRKGVRVGLLRIYRNGYVTHSDSDNSRASGQVELANNVLNITLTNGISGRTGFCCVRVSVEPPSKGDTFYKGAFAGVSSRNDEDEAPMASLFYMEFCGKEEPFEEKAEKFVPMESLPSKVREFFSVNPITNLTFVGRQEE